MNTGWEKFTKTETRVGVWEVTEMDTEEKDTERVIGVEEGSKAVMVVVVDVVVGEEIGERTG